MKFERVRTSVKEKGSIVASNLKQNDLLPEKLKGRKYLKSKDASGGDKDAAIDNQKKTARNSKSWIDNSRFLETKGEASSSNENDWKLILVNGQ